MSVHLDLMLACLLGVLLAKPFLSSVGQGSPIVWLVKWRERNDSENRASSLARLSPRLPRQREFMRHLFVVFMRHLFVVDSLDKRIQNEKELIHLASAGGGGYFVFVWRVLT